MGQKSSKFTEAKEAGYSLQEVMAVLQDTNRSIDDVSKSVDLVEEITDKEFRFKRELLSIYDQQIKLCRLLVALPYQLHRL